jgi:putative phage-type endonuclease
VLQRSEEWFAARVGVLTASRVDDAVRRTKTGYTAKRDDYKAQLVAERLTGISQSADLSKVQAVQWGVETESQACAAYEFFNDVEVEQVGIVMHPTIAMCGASPDGFVGDGGIIEIKCPNTSTHISYLKAGVVPQKYINQMLWQLACTGRKWADFISFDPRLDQANQLLIVRFVPDEGEISSLEQDAKLFLFEVDADVEWLRNRHE